MNEVSAPSTYLARDYESFRKLLLARLEEVRPGTNALPVASIEMLMIEAMAYMGDYLAYYQDAVGTEAYVETARQRKSLARHAALLGKTINEGCCARTLVRFQTHAEQAQVALGTQLLTALSDFEDLHIDDDPERDEVTYFSTLHTVTVRKEHCTIPLAAQQDGLFTSGNQALLQGSYGHLRSGDFLILHAKRHDWFHPVRLTSCVVSADQTRIGWAADDLLPIGAPSDAQWEAWGNLALAEEGRMEKVGRPLEFSQETTHPLLRAPMPAFAERFDEGSDTSAAARLLKPDPLAAEPSIILEEQWCSDGPADPAATWHGSRKVFDDDGKSRIFVPELIDNAYIALRFARAAKAQDEGVPLYPSYRVSQGSRGNIAPEALIHMIGANPSIYAATNPRAATGGRDPESLEEARGRLLSNCAERALTRCVSKVDFANVATGFAGASEAKVDFPAVNGARLVTVQIAPQPGRELDKSMTAELQATLQARAIVGDIVEVTAVPVIKPYLSLSIQTEHGTDLTALRKRIEYKLGKLSPGIGKALMPNDILSALEDTDGISHSKLTRLDLDHADLGAGAGKVLQITPDDAACVRIDSAHIALNLVGAV
ncbi:baseplate J/gp47 family protein [uncultured Erythrobacter sp.]|uniref:baseplate J/gp47 family protein n=1 Tax=uncultured Erythrobacter sp. TaxID=263913 RepID=UPI002629E9CF|nr:baseplate J/gp47 family protein [uncultured Erythrobacter sp.]